MKILFTQEELRKLRISFMEGRTTFCDDVDCSKLNCYLCPFFNLTGYRARKIATELTLSYQDHLEESDD